MLEVQNVSKSFGETHAVMDASFDVIQGEILALTGESGCGKSTLLRIIGGLEKADKGAIFLDGKDITNTSPENRRFGFVFQNLSLFPHLSVEKNTLFSVSKKARSKKRLDELLGMTGLTGLEKRYPHELSGGQQQRVALARALAIDPKILILDEPFSSLDELVKAKIRNEIFSLLDHLNITTVMVSHQAQDSFLIADKLVVMKAGRILQKGTPAEVYENPSSEYISNFFGASVILSGQKNATGASTPFGNLSVENLPSKFSLCIRPENIEISNKEGFNLTGLVEKKLFNGPHDVLTIKSHKTDDRFSFETERTLHEVGDTIFLRVPEERILVFN